ncbi:MAG TPA: hypothetical protein VHR97_06705 [Candidatus Baltobacteraceae bacterium]|jgi:hypothetical protein|nr:hypothetical protein [Candidatus Baltobacteraceae bacterium]
MRKGFKFLPLVLFAALALAAVPARANAALQCYPLIPAEMLTTVNSAEGFSGQVFQFKTSAAVSSNGFEFPSGTLGYGVVLNAIPASNRTRNGIVVLEPRFLLVNGQEVQIAGDPADASILTHDPSVFQMGLRAIPFGGGIVATEAVNGTNITVGPGYAFHIVPIGNLQERGPCVQPQGK